MLLSRAPLFGNTGPVTEDKARFLVITRLADIGGLVHGFGNAGWNEAAFLAFAASRDLRPVIMLQVHSDTVRRLDGFPAAKPEGDALMTDVPGLLLVVRTADCLPVFLVDLRNRAVAAVHCGWRGTEKRIIEKAVRAMGRAYGTESGEVLAALGPCIGSACYEVGPEVRKGFLRAGFPPSVFTECHEGGQKSLLDLRAANVWLLENSGFKKDNILNVGSSCTHCEPHFLSYRRNPGEHLRMYNFIGFQPAS
jgi:purine-nucleoside/S-methyl-5'-thioadenosine phosphorylase / adenosine deaminase